MVGDFEIRVREISEQEAALIAQLEQQFDEHPRPASFSVMAGALLEDGSTAFSVDVRSRKNWVCAEPVLIGSILRDARPLIAFIVALCRNQKTGNVEVISPCGSCREVLRNHAQKGWVALRLDSGKIVAASIEDLFPQYAIFPG